MGHIRHVMDLGGQMKLNEFEDLVEGKRIVRVQARNVDENLIALDEIVLSNGKVLILSGGQDTCYVEEIKE